MNLRKIYRNSIRKTWGLIRLFCLLCLISHHCSIDLSQDINNNFKMDSDKLTDFAKKLNDTLVDLKRMHEQVNDLRVKAVLVKLELLKCYQPINVIILDKLRQKEMEKEKPQAINNDKMEQ